jgi:hypothetical protein
MPRLGAWVARRGEVPIAIQRQRIALSSCAEMKDGVLL